MKKLYVRMFILLAVTISLLCVYLLYGLPLHSTKLLQYALSIRIPKLLAILLASFAIGSASFVFQSIISNVIVTPCLLGMNSLYTLTHTLIVFLAGSTSLFVTHVYGSFFLDLAVMGIVSLVVYGLAFEKTHYNILYILLVGTVLTSFFSSVQNTLIRVMDPNEYDALLAQLVASFTNVNEKLIAISTVLLLLIAVVLRKELAMLDVISLGKDQAINLGVDYTKTVRRLLLGVTFYIAIATALVGPISFLGLIIANLARRYLVTYRHRLLIPTTVLMGMITVLFSQVLMEKVFRYNIPVSVFITLFGGSYFLYLLVKERKRVSLQ